MSRTIWPRSDAIVAGATCPLEMDAEFSTGRAVYTTDSTSQYLIHRSTTPEGALAGDLLTAEEWKALLAAEEALSITPTPVERPVVVWVFRSSQRDHWWAGHLEQLAQLGALVHQETPRKPRTTRICLVHPLSAGTARDLWSQTSSDDAWRALVDGQRREALRHARRAFCLAPRLMERDVALLAVSYSQAGKNEDSEGVLAMVRRSKGEAFYAEVLARRTRLLADLQASQTRPVRSSARAARSRRAFDDVRTAGLQEWSQNHEAPSS